MIGNSFSLYLLFNLLLILSYVVFAVGVRLLRGGRTRPLYLLRCGQAAILFALIVPPLVSLLPKGATPALPYAMQLPLAEIAHVLRAKESPAVKILTAEVKNSQARGKVYALSQQNWQSIAGLLFSLAFTLLSVRLLRRLKTLNQLLQRATPFKRFGKVRLVTSSEVAVPFSTLHQNEAWVVVPESMLGNWSDFKLAVSHELQHHRQRDTHWALGIEFLSLIFFANPAIYFWKRRIYEFQELSCDEALIGRKISSYDYGSCLVRVAEAALGNRRQLVGTASMAAGSEHPIYFKSFLRKRVEMLYEYKNATKSRKASLLLGTAVLGTVFTVACVATQVASTANPETVASGELITEPAIQKIAEEALTKALIRHKASLGFVVVSDPNTGRVLAVANQDRMETQAERTPHWALALRIGPASLSKAIVTAAAVEKGVTSLDSMHNCEKSKYLWDGTLYQDWKAFDTLSTADTVIHSSNICGIKVGQKLGAHGVSKAFKDFGFGRGGTAEGFPEARPGAVPEPKKDDDSAYIATIATGYGGMYVSPIETVQAFGAIANGGYLLKPQSSASSEVNPHVIRRVLSEATSSKMRDVLAEVMVKGTAMNSASKLYRLAGKTATGYSRTHVGHDTLGGDSNMAAFIGFGPVENPRVVVFAVVENPTDQKGVHGAYHAAPLFKEVTEKTLTYLKVASK